MPSLSRTSTLHSLLGILSSSFLRYNRCLLEIDGCPLNLLWPWICGVFVDRTHDKMQLAQSEIERLPFYHLKQKNYC
jgi:hypothetical protein